MPVHKKVAKAVKKVGKAALKRVGVRFKKRPVASSTSKGPRRRRTPSLRSAAKAAQRITVGIGKKGSPGTRGIISKHRGRTMIGRSSIIRGILQGSKRKTTGPPKVGFRTIKGKGGKRITIKRPSPRAA